MLRELHPCGSGRDLVTLEMAVVMPMGQVTDRPSVGTVHWAVTVDWTQYTQTVVLTASQAVYTLAQLYAAMTGLHFSDMTYRLVCGPTVASPECEIRKSDTRDQAWDTPVSQVVQDMGGPNDPSIWVDVVAKSSGAGLPPAWHLVSPAVTCAGGGGSLHDLIRDTDEPDFTEIDQHGSNLAGGAGGAPAPARGDWLQREASHTARDQSPARIPPTQHDQRRRAPLRDVPAPRDRDAARGRSADHPRTGGRDRDRDHDRAGPSRGDRNTARVRFEEDTRRYAAHADDEWTPDPRLMSIRIPRRERNEIPVYPRHTCKMGCDMRFCALAHPDAHYAIHKPKGVKQRVQCLEAGVGGGGRHCA